MSLTWCTTPGPQDVDGVVKGISRRGQGEEATRGIPDVSLPILLNGACREEIHKSKAEIRARMRDEDREGIRARMREED